MTTSINQQNYRAFPAVSNSDLGWLQKFWMPENQFIDLQKAYANGNLIDAMVTEPEKVNYFTCKVEGEKYSYSKDEFENAKLMKRAVMADPFSANIIKMCTFQHISYQPNFKITHDGFEFELAAKAKWDFLAKKINLGADLKSTACTTQKQCEEAARYFEYDRSRAWYMDLEGIDNDILIFVSKVNHKIFRIPIKRGDDFYKSGKAKYQKLAHQWHLFFT